MRLGLREVRPSTGLTYGLYSCIYCIGGIGDVCVCLRVYSYVSSLDIDTDPTL